MAIVALLAAASLVAAAPPVWQHAVGGSGPTLAGLSRATPGAPPSFVGLQGDAVLVTDDEGRARQTWTLPGAEQLLVARHVNDAAVGGVDAVVIARQDDSCSVVGVNTTAAAAAGRAWTLNGILCGAKVEASLSDDGSTLLLATGGQLLSIDAQQGRVSWKEPLSGEASSVQLIADGSAAMLVMNSGYAQVRSLSARGGSKTRGSAIAVATGAQDGVTLCPLGVFVAVNGVVRRWNGSDYAVVFTVPPPRGMHVAVSSAISMNGGGSAPNGCIVAFGWSDGGQATAVTVSNLLTTKLLWQWAAEGGQTVAMSYHMQFLAVSQSDGQLLLFGNGSNSTLLTSCCHAGQSVQVVATNAPLPQSALTPQHAVWISSAWQEQLAAWLWKGQ